MSLARNLSNAAIAAGGLAPSGVVLPFAGSSAPAGWLMCYGQAVNRDDYSALFGAIGTTYGAGDGSTTFNLPDMRGRVPGGKDDMGGSAASRLNVTLTGTRGSTSNGNITGLSSTAGLAVGMKAFGTGIGSNAVITAVTSGTAITLSVNNTSTGTASIRFGVVDGATLGAVGGSHVHALDSGQMPAHTHTAVSGGASGAGQAGVATDSAVSTSTAQSTSSTGSGYSHPNIQPTLILNSIIKT